MLQINDLTIIHTKDLSDILRGFSFTLGPGDKAVVIGEEGNGKSTLIKAIADPKLIADYAQLSGEIAARGEIIGYLPQELDARDAPKTLYEFYGDLPAFFDLTPKELAALTRRFGVAADFCYSAQTLATLSGGEKIKAQLIRLLMQRPTVYLLDEPSNDIDIETLEQLESFICESEAPMLFVSHDETLIERTANTVIHLERIRRKTLPRYTIARMPYQAYIRQRLSSFEHQAQMAVNEKREYDKKLEKYRQIEAKVEYRQRTVTRQDPHSGQLLKKRCMRLRPWGNALNAKNKP